MSNEKILQTPDMISNIIEIINSPKSDEEIQELENDLYGDLVYEDCNVSSLSV